jgi:hypothetical protein
MVFIVVFRVVMLCGFVDGYQCIGGPGNGGDMFLQDCVTMYAQRQNPEDHNQHLHRHQYFKSHNVIMTAVVLINSWNKMCIMIFLKLLVFCMSPEHLTGV